jgi:ferredoxin-NADP reductase
VPRRIVYRPGALPLRWSFEQDGWSPNSLMTGSWEDADRRLKANALAKQWRQFRIGRMVEESASIRSFHLEPVDGAGLIPHEAGQHLPIRLTTGDGVNPLIRTYTLSVAPSDGIYRISVKRQGLASTHLHGLKVGDVIEARAPAGQFTIDAAERRPAVLMAAGIGITPMLAMLRHIIFEGRRTRHTRSTWLLYSARSKADRAFDREIRELTADVGAVRVIRLLTDLTDATENQDYEVAGRIDIALLRAALPFDDYDFYLCGPATFSQSLYDGLRSLNIADARIHAEAFGPSSLRRSGAAAVPAGPAPATEPVAVTFARSATDARWTPASGSLLDLAEAAGLAPEFSCRGGSCGTCRTPILAGDVAYQKTPSFQTAANEALICCAVPAANRLVLDV